MGAISKKLRSMEDGRGGTQLSFRCPGCSLLAGHGRIHAVGIGAGPGPRWGYNGNPDRPTFTPSVLAQWTEPSDDPAKFGDTAHDMRMVCHSFVTDGRIQFLGDSTHPLAGQTVDLPDWSME